MASARPQDSVTQPASDRRASTSFPSGFIWGTATSAYQIEGAVKEDGRGRSSQTPKAFANYAGYVAERLSDRVKSFFTVNEVGRFVNFGYGWGIDAPGLKLPPAVLNQVHHNVALGHGLAVQAIRARARAGTKVGPAENIAACLPAIDTPENIRAAEIATRELTAGFLNVVLTGKYTDAFLKYAVKDAPKCTDDELKVIASPNDFVGLNLYAP